MKVETKEHGHGQGFIMNVLHKDTAGSKLETGRIISKMFMDTGEEKQKSQTKI